MQLARQPLPLDHHRQRLGLLEQARVLDRNRGLVSDRQRQVGVVRRVVVGLIVIQREHADHMILHQQRHA